MAKSKVLEGKAKKVPISDGITEIKKALVAPPKKQGKGAKASEEDKPKVKSGEAHDLNEVKRMYNALLAKYRDLQSRYDEALDEVERLREEKRDLEFCSDKLSDRINRAVSVLYGEDDQPEDTGSKDEPEDEPEGTDEPEDEPEGTDEPEDTDEAEERVYDFDCPDCPDGVIDTYIFRASDGKLYRTTNPWAAQQYGDDYHIEMAYYKDGRFDHVATFEEVMLSSV